MTQSFFKTLEVMAMSPDARLQAARNMEATGGHFASCIGQAFQYADSNNQVRLLETFGELFIKYATQAK